MGNIVSKIGAETPTVGKLQEVMTSVVDYFKTLGYVPKKGSLERVPAADEFVTKNNVPHAVVSNLTEHTYSVAEVPVQKYNSYKQWEGSNWQWLNREDFDGGKCVRRIYTETGDYPHRGIQEFEYKGDALSKVTEYEDMNGRMLVRHKTIDVSTGDYCEEKVFGSHHNMKTYYNKLNQKLQESETRVVADSKFVTNKFYDPKTKNLTLLEIDEAYNGGYHVVHKCDINQETGKISKYVYQDSKTGKELSSFEFDEFGDLTYYKSSFRGLEYKYDPKLGEAVVTGSDGSVQSGKHIKELFSYDFEKDAISRLPDEMKKYV